MAFPPRYVLLIDGAFLIRKLERRLGFFPQAAHVDALAASIARNECVRGLSCLRTYFYHARPAAGVLTNPLSKQSLSLAETDVYAAHDGLLRAIEALPDFVVRLGETSTRGWRLRKRFSRSW